MNVTPQTELFLALHDEFHFIINKTNCIYFFKCSKYDVYMIHVNRFTAAKDLTNASTAVRRSRRQAFFERISVSIPAKSHLRYRNNA